MLDDHSVAAQVEALAQATEITVFDSNAYRALVRNNLAAVDLRVASLVAAERAAHIRAMVSPFVIVELASHLADPADEHYTECAAAIHALYLHCRVGVEGRERLATLGDPEALLCYALYQRLPDLQLPSLEFFIELTRAVYSDPSPVGLASVRDHLVRCKAVADNFEENYVALMNSLFDGVDLEDHVQKKAMRLALESTEGLTIGATYAVLRAQSLLGLRDKDEEMAERVLAVRDQFRAATWLYVYKLHLMLDPSFDIGAPRHRNSVWDIDLSYLIGQSVSSRPVLLVTNDREIRNAASAAELASAVETPGSYFSRMGVSGRSLKSR